MIAKAKEGKCLTPKCDGLRAVRGLCICCYGNARQIVQRGISTWDELQKLGLIATTSKNNTSLLRVALNKAREIKAKKTRKVR